MAGGSCVPGSTGLIEKLGRVRMTCSTVRAKACTLYISIDCFAFLGCKIQPILY